MKRLLRHPTTQAALARLLGLYLAFALRTTRWSLDGQEHMAPHAAGAPVVVAFWHERLPMMPMLWVLARQMPEGRSVGNRAHVLVSQHRDGRFIGAVVSRFALDVVLGSSSRGGAKGLRILLNLLAGGDHIAITPDGPRGPRRVAAAGVAQLAALSGAPVLPCAAQTTRHWVLRTWDRMAVPKPFGRGVVVCLPTIAVSREGWQDSVPAIGDALTAAAERADRLCLA
ncbi:MAG: lysophospholipid acyltransferase family protein [Acetobacteraceae bacterium]